MINTFKIKQRFIKLMVLRLKSASGETLVETLIAVLISSLAMVTLAMAITSSVNIIRRSKAVLEDYYAGSDALVEHKNPSDTPGDTDDKPVLKLEETETQVDDFGGGTVKYYVNDVIHSRDGNPVVSYELS